MVRRPTPTGRSLFVSGSGRSLFVSGSGPVSFRFRLYFRETFPLLNDGAKSKVRSLFVVGNGRCGYIPINLAPYCVPIFTLALFPWQGVAALDIFTHGGLIIFVGFSLWIDPPGLHRTHPRKWPYSRPRSSLTSGLAPSLSPVPRKLTFGPPFLSFAEPLSGLSTPVAPTHKSSEPISGLYHMHQFSNSSHACFLQHVINQHINFYKRDRWASFWGPFTRYSFVIC